MVSLPSVGGERRAYHWGANQPANQRLTVAQAAVVLGITEGAVRSRIKQGTLPTTKEGETVFVLLGGGTSKANQSPKTDVPADQGELIEELRARVEDLRAQLEQASERDRENRRIIVALTARIPAIEAPQEPSETPSEATEQPGRVDPNQPSRARRSPQSLGPGGGGCSGHEGRQAYARRAD